MEDEKKKQFIAPVRDEPIDHVEIMEMFEREEELSTVESAALFVKSVFPLQMMEQLPAVDESRSKSA